MPANESLISDYIADFTDFVKASPSSYHAAAEIAGRLQDAGFEQLDEDGEWGAGPRRGASGRFVVREGAIIAWVQPQGATATTPLNIVGTHTDSPGFKLKPHASFAAEGWWQAAVEVYGGPLLNSWLDRELELAGRIVTRDEHEYLVRTGPFLRIPQLAVHLDRTVNDGLTLDRERHTQPVFGVCSDAPGADLVAHIAESVGVGAEDVAGFDLITVDSNLPTRFGLEQRLLASPRLDNLSSVFAGVRAILAASRRPVPDQIAVFAAFDHEEVGSATRSGAQGPFLADVLTRISEGLGGGASERLRSWSKSWCVSADAGHSVHPNYPDRHDPHSHPIAGAGPMIKINANQRYVSDAAGEALWERVCKRADVPVQRFVSNNAVPCGSTIGPLTATRLGIRTVDVGVPLLSMHSARELAHIDDLADLSLALTAFFELPHV